MLPCCCLCKAVSQHCLLSEISWPYVYFWEVIIWIQDTSVEDVLRLSWSPPKMGSGCHWDFIHPFKCPAPPTSGKGVVRKLDAANVSRSSSSPCPPLTRFPHWESSSEVPWKEYGWSETNYSSHPNSAMWSFFLSLFLLPASSKTLEWLAALLLAIEVTFCQPLSWFRTLSITEMLMAILKGYVEGETR